ncbi:hypothetical protein NEIELOOT_00216 [Neisseria elongata subsp. glycolytica ATCC 29315]|uniref:Uncharacterized protein n=1 Tax=Neisseria elongata subsp. glycolytica ATCC 29315 TaxID=546263 RepID=D4DME8_NEIEG|nr:hypothetical protein NEIELOOT_00216 [Neisseria elongata subsp. glycolytica ATCC 29315]
MIKRASIKQRRACFNFFPPIRLARPVFRRPFRAWVKMRAQSVCRDGLPDI